RLLGPLGALVLASAACTSPSACPRNIEHAIREEPRDGALLGSMIWDGSACRIALYGDGIQCLSETSLAHEMFHCSLDVAGERDSQHAGAAWAVIVPAMREAMRKAGQ